MGGGLAATFIGTTRALKPVENRFGQSVTYVLGTLCHRWVRAGPRMRWRTQDDDFRTYLGDFVATLPLVNFPE
jgi:hypothetical protein